MEEGDLKTRIEYERKDEFGYLFHSFNRMVDKLDELVNQVYVAKILAQKAELKQLQAQINPHFLYNSFFTLQRTIIGEDIDKAALYAEKLGSYFKYITRNRQEEVALEKEVEHARIFTDIQSMRFSRRIKIEFGCLPEECRDWIVPRLILQPLLENAFEHGL
ncbi:MAG: histidine kinase, partial [Treponemataceae bacterium]|nr:histidine kinase [Treponemataceae bacterium]